MRKSIVHPLIITALFAANLARADALGMELIDLVATELNPLDQVSPAMAASDTDSAESQLCPRRPGDDPTGTFCQGDDTASVDPEDPDCRNWGRNDPRGFCFDAHFITRNFPNVETDREGVRIDMTVYVPSAVRRPLHAPLIIHSHGFGGRKAANFNLPGAFAGEQAAKQMWQEHGYFVISFSERGFGKSTGEIEVLAPELEGLDANEVIDWAIKHFRAGIDSFEFDPQNPEHVSTDFACPPGQSACLSPSLLQDDDGGPLDEARPDPAVGMLGYSYGGAFQYTAAHAADRFLPYQRIDAISPQGTYFDLRYSLAQHDVPKTGWINILNYFAVSGSTVEGLQSNQVRPIPPLLIQARAESEAFNRVRGETSQIFMRHSPVNYCDPENGSSIRNVDVFHIQGLQDTLFNFNDGYNNVICAQKSGNDARLLMLTGGHALPAISPANHSGNTGMSIDEVVWCGTDTSMEAGLTVSDLTVAWYREKLQGIEGAADVVPVACIVQENLDPEDPRIDAATGKLGHPQFTPLAGFEPAVPNYNKHRFAGEGVTYASLAEIPVGCVAGGPGCELKNSTHLLFGPAGGSEFVPLYTVPENETKVIAGIPTLQLEMNIDHPDPILFVGVGVRRGGALTFNPLTERTGALTNSGVGEIYANELDARQASVSGQRGTNDPELLHAQLLAIRSTRYPHQARSGPLDQPMGELTTGERIENNPRGPLWFGCEPNVSGCKLGRMVGISSRLNPGDEVGLYFFGSHLQYASNSSRLPGAADVQFTVNLPIFDR